MSALSKGNELAKKLSLKVKQSLYSDWGNFYAVIKNYPCALFDKDGYIIIQNEEEVELNNIKVGKRTNIPQKISSLKGYVLTRSLLSQVAEEVQMNNYREGSVTQITINKYERDRSARKVCLEHYGYQCIACGIQLEETYGDVAKGFIHVHHIKPLSEIREEYMLNPINDLKPVCPNCHSIIHLKNPPMSIDELKQIIEFNKSSSKSSD